MNGIGGMNCEMCGKKGKLFRVKVEGSVVRACESCSKFGKRVLEEVSLEKNFDEEKKVKKILKEEEEKIEVVVGNFNEILRKAREKRGLTQEEVGKKINEKESVIQKLENKRMEPSLKLARKLEKFFGVELVKEESSLGKKIHQEKGEGKGLTLGDLIGK